MTTDMQLYQAWKTGLNTYESAQQFDLKEHDVDRRVRFVRRAFRRAKQAPVVAPVPVPARPKPKLGFTGRDTVSGYPRGRS